MTYSPQRSGWLWLCICGFAGLLAAWCLVGAAHAQAQASTALFNLDRSAFPLVRAGLVAYDAGGEFIDGLQSRNVTIIEAGSRLPVSELQLARPGAQFVTALTFGTALAVRDGTGISRFENLVNGLQQLLHIALISYTGGLGPDG